MSLHFCPRLRCGAILLFQLQITNVYAVRPAAAPDAGPHDRYTEPEDFPREGCVGGTLGADVSGNYHLPLDYGGGFLYPLTIRVNEGATPTGIVSGPDNVQRIAMNETSVITELSKPSDKASPLATNIPISSAIR